jgi:hypothetical protein
MAKKKRKYPYAECFVNVDEFKRKYTSEFLGGEIDLHSYKDAIIFRLTPGDAELRDAFNKLGLGHLLHGVWLRGDDFDALIKLLQEARRTWVASYRRDVRAHQRRKRSKR